MSNKVSQLMFIIIQLQFKIKQTSSELSVNRLIG